MTESTPAKNFADRLEAAVGEKGSCLVVGLDPTVDRLPPDIHARVRGAAGDVGWTAHAAVAVSMFLSDVIDRVAEHAVAVKPNTGFFERFGPAGWDSLCQVCERAKRAGLLVITDAKRGDIGHTAEAYAAALLDEVPDTVGNATDAVTVHTYLGEDGVRPFLARVRDRGKGVFALVRTSNPSAAAIQDLDVGGEALFERVARLVASWGEGLEGEGGLNPVGAVVGATVPEHGARVRAILPNAWFLVPGYGAQGAGAEELRPLFAGDGRGVVVNASRSVLYAFEGRDGPWQDAVEAAAREAKESLEAVRQG